MKQQGESFESVLHATEIKLRAERRMGELLREMEKRSGARDGKTGLHGETPFLADLGLSKIQSHRWQTEAELPDKQPYLPNRGDFDTA